MEKNLPDVGSNQLTMNGPLDYTRDLFKIIEYLLCAVSYVNLFIVLYDLSQQFTHYTQLSDKKAED